MQATLDSFAGLDFGGRVFTGLFVFMGLLLAFGILKAVVLGRLRIVAGKTKNQFDDLLVDSVESVKWPFYFFLAFYAGLNAASAPLFIIQVFWAAFVVVSTYYAVKIVQAIVKFFADRIIARRLEEEKTADVSLIRNMASIINVLVWVLAALLLLSNLGYNVSALIAGMGIGGIAIAFALQNVLEDVFSSLAIYFDKPFVVGEFIIIGDDLGEVKKIGIKTTRIKHLQGQELVVSNKELTNTRVHNYGKMSKRRVVFEFGVTYDTPTEKLEKIPATVKKIIESAELTTFDRAHFKKFGSSALNFEAVYYLDSGDYAKYMDVQQAINLGIVKAFQKDKIEFAFPTQTIHLEK